jgi:hypothetical protein
MWFLIIFGVLTIGFAIGWILEQYDYEVYATFTVIFAICLIVTGICAFHTPYARNITIINIEQQREIIENRGDKSEFDSIKYFEEVIDINTWIITNQEKNKSQWFDIFIPDEINDVELLK